MKILQLIRLYTIVVFVSIVHFSYAEASEKTLTVCTNGAPLHFDPAISEDSTTLEASAFLIFDQLVSTEYNSNVIRPHMFESWRPADDFTSIVLNLRTDISFHSNKEFTPSRNFNADDVVYSFERMLDENHPWHDIFPESFDYFYAMDMDKTIAKVEKIDDFTVKFTTTGHFEAPFLATFSLSFGSIYSKEYMEFLLKQGTPEKLKTHPIGTGPWIFENYVPDEAIYYRANPDYFLGAPKFQRLAFDITLDPLERRKKLQNGTCDRINYLSLEDIRELQKDDNVRVLYSDGPNISYIALNTQKEPMKNKDVRLALAMATDKFAIVSNVFDAQARIAVNPIPPKIWSYNYNNTNYPYNLSDAKKLLEKAGYPEGFTMKLVYTSMPRIYNTQPEKLVEVLQEQWRKIGVMVELEEIPWDVYLSDLPSFNYDAVISGWAGDTNDPDNFLYNLLSCTNVGGLNDSLWCNAEFEALITEARHSNDFEYRKELYMAAQEVFHEEQPWIPLAYTNVTEAISNKVQNYKITLFGSQKFPPFILELEEE